jgi:hypothetical protein
MEAADNSPLPNIGNLFTNDKKIEPCVVSSWIEQAAMNVIDVVVSPCSAMFGHSLDAAEHDCDRFFAVP